MTIFQEIGAWFSALPAQLRLLSWTDILDVAILTVVYYWIYRFVRERRGGRLLIGLGVLVVTMTVSAVLQIHAVSYILRSLFQVGFIAILVLFQPEVRGALERLSVQPFRFSRRIRKTKNAETEAMVKEICDAVSDLSRNRTGALIVIERTTHLGDVILSGVHVDAELSTYLLQNIFFKDAPLHDGAVIVREHRICAAGCFLPLTEQTDVDPNLGTRHRAALGISENSDAVTVVVSEETGGVSVTYDRKLQSNFTYSSLKTRLVELLTNTEGAGEKPARK